MYTSTCKINKGETDMIISKQTILDIDYTSEVKAYTEWGRDIEFVQLCKYQKFANEFCAERGLRGIKVQFNGRIKNSLGRYVQRYSGECIELARSQAIIDYKLDKHNLIDTLIHELTHYQVKCQGGDYADGSVDFEHELAVNGGSSSGSTKTWRKETAVPLRYMGLWDVYTAYSKENGERVAVVHEKHSKAEKYVNGSYTVKGIRVNLKRTGFVVNEIVSR